jgi:hypothetical protein
MAGLAAVTALCLWGTLETYAFETTYRQQNRDPYMIGAQFDRLASVSALVPENAILGYLTDVQQGSVTESAMLIGAQDVLAPRVVVPGAGREWVLGYFTRPSNFGGVRPQPRAGTAAGFRQRRSAISRGSEAVS